MSEDLTTAYLLGAEHMRDKLHKQAEEIERLRVENEKLRLALLPFARIAADYEDWETEKITMIVLLYHLRAAAAAIRESGE